MGRRPRTAHPLSRSLKYYDFGSNLCRHLYFLLLDHDSYSKALPPVNRGMPSSPMGLNDDCFDVYIMKRKSSLSFRGFRSATNLKMASPCFSIKAAIVGRPSLLVSMRRLAFWIAVKDALLKT